jgi:GT2 family glycosyltransferase
LNPQLAALVNEFQLEESKGLAAAINQVAFGLPAGVEYFNWLGDDDLLTPNSISMSAKALDNNPTASGVFGKCEYINSKGNRIGVNSSGLWATKLIMFGPDLIPQPGALLRLSTFKQIGGLRTQYKLAFDVDMFIRLQKAHPLIYVPHILGKFRWHNDSLSVKSRLVSAKESSVIRRKNLPKSIRRLSLLWEIPVIILTYAAGWFVQIKNWRLN